MVKIKFALATAKAFTLNCYAEWRQNRLENSKRRWHAHKVGGGGVVPLGRVNQSDALKKVSNFGSVTYVDTSVACIFYNDKFSS